MRTQASAANARARPAGQVGELLAHSRLARKPLRCERNGSTTGHSLPKVDLRDAVPAGQGCGCGCRWGEGAVTAANGPGGIMQMIARKASQEDNRSVCMPPIGWAMQLQMRVQA